MENSLEILKFELNEKFNELDRLRIETFTYNPRINELAREISLLQEKINEIENKESEEADA